MVSQDVLNSKFYSLILDTKYKILDTNYMQERIQKILSAQGICSRRKAEEYITQGLVTVNGEIVELGQKADPEVDVVEVDGQVLQDRQEMFYYLMNKPSGVLTANIHADAAHPTPTVRDMLPKRLQGAVYPVGRLDKATSGLLLLTNDGVLAYRLTHPKFNHQKEYLVYTVNKLTDTMLKELSGFMLILGEKIKPVHVERKGEYSFTITLTEGKNRQIRRMCSKVGIGIKKLIRIRIMGIMDDKLESGNVRILSKKEVEQLLIDVGVLTP
jgi:23S rRNA pseudouridine2605 synthase